MNGVPKLIAWYFWTLLHQSTLMTTSHPQRVAATCHPPAPTHRSRTLTWPVVGAFRCRLSCGLGVLEGAGGALALRTSCILEVFEGDGDDR